MPDTAPQTPPKSPKDSQDTDWGKKLAAVRKAVAKATRNETADSVAIGKAVHKAVVARVFQAAPKTRRDFRAELIAEISADVGIVAVTLNRHVRVYQTSALFEPDLTGLPVKAVVELAGLITRDAQKEQWSIRPKIVDQAKQLVKRAIGDKMPAGHVQREVGKLLGRKAREKKPAPTVQQRVAKLLPKLSRAELTALHRAIGQKLRDKPADPVPSRPSSIAIPDPVDVQPAKKAA